MRQHTLLAIPLAVAASLSLTGCCYYELRDTIDNCSANMRSCWTARMAWREHKDSCGEMPYKAAYGHGFRDGYADVCNGKDGCAPTMPPRCYWNDCFGDCDGKPKVAAYFNGYSQGAYVAQAEGCGNCGRLAVSRPACPSGACMTGPIGHATATPIGEPVVVPETPPVSGTQNPPPPAPAAGGPAIPPDPAYENYDPEGLYYE